MSNYQESEYLDAMHHILTNGETRPDRTGVGTRTVFGMQMHYDLNGGFPAITTKQLAWKSVVSELLWFMEGSTDERRLCEILHGTRDISKKTIWTANADKQGRALGHENTETVKLLGPVYGKQWRNWNGTDQLQGLIHGLRHQPHSRRHIISAWNVDDLDQMALPPCHTLIQFDVSQDNRLSSQLYQRSADMFLGVPFNIASYALLTHIIAQICKLKVGKFVHTIGNAHIYLNHFDAVNEQIKREPTPFPELIMPKFNSLNSVLATKVDDYKLAGYRPQAKIFAEMAV